MQSLLRAAQDRDRYGMMVANLRLETAREEEAIELNLLIDVV